MRATALAVAFNAQEEEQEYHNTHEAFLGTEFTKPLDSVGGGHRIAEKSVHGEPARKDELALEDRHISRRAPFTYAPFDRGFRYHQQRCDGERSRRGSHVEEEGAVDLRVQCALDRKERRERSADDFTRTRRDLVEDLRPPRLEDTKHADHLEMRYAHFLQGGACVARVRKAAREDCGGCRWVERVGRVREMKLRVESAARARRGTHRSCPSGRQSRGAQQSKRA